MMSILAWLADHSDLFFLFLVVLEITVIGILGWAAIRLNRRDAATRYAIGCVSLVLMSIAAPATWFIQQSEWASWGWVRRIRIDPSLIVSDQPAPVSTSAPMWVWIWGFGAAFILLRVAVGLVRVHRLRQSSFPLEKLSSGISVYATDDTGPAVVGALRPAVLMPRKLLSQLSEEEINDVLAHEFAHVAHKHLLVAMFQRFLAAAYWPHPLVHLLNREMISAREEMCDNAVLRSAGAARYARVLLRVAECRLQSRQFSASLGLFSPTTTLEERVKSLLDPNRRIESSMNKQKVVASCAALSLGMVAVAGAKVQTDILTMEPDLVAIPLMDLKVVEGQKSDDVINLLPLPSDKPGQKEREKGKKSEMTVKGSQKRLQVKRASPTKIYVEPVELQSVAISSSEPIRIQLAPSTSLPKAQKAASKRSTKPAEIISFELSSQVPARIATVRSFIATPLSAKPTKGRVVTPSEPGRTVFETTSFSIQEPAKGFQEVRGVAISIDGSGKGKYKIESVPGFSFQKLGEDRIYYRDMKGEDRPDLLTHPLERTTNKDQASVSISERRLGFSATAVNGRGFQIHEGNVAKLRSLQSRFTTSAKSAGAIVSPLLSPTNLDKAKEYRLRYNEEKKEWELVPAKG